MTNAEHSRLRLMIADDHGVVREGLRNILALQSDFEIVAEAIDSEDALKKVEEFRPDVLILDVWMPRRSGIEILPEIRTLSPDTKVLFLTAFIDRQQVVDALKEGLRGVVLKDSSSEILVRSIRRVADGEHWIDRSTLAEWGKQSKTSTSGMEVLTEREKQVFREVATGSSNREVANTLCISEDTVKRHLTHIFEKLGVSSRVELVLKSVQNRDSD